jgi:hypothetical protein
MLLQKSYIEFNLLYIVHPQYNELIENKNTATLFLNKFKKIK